MRRTTPFMAAASAPLFVLHFAFCILHSVIPARAAEAPRAARPPAARPGAEAPAEPAVESLPVAAQAILATNPSTPVDMARAARVLAELDQPKLARDFLKKIIDAKADQKTLAEMAEKLGTPAFGALSSNAALQPEGAAVAKLVLDAWDEQARSPERIRAAVKQLQDPSELKREQAFREVMAARGGAVGPLVDVLADASRANEHARARAALVAIGSDAVDPLIGMLENAEPQLMAHAIRALGEMNARSSIPFIVGPYTAENTDPAVRAAAAEALRRLVGALPTRGEAIGLLTSHAKEYFSRKRAAGREVDGQTTIWSWDTAKKQTVARALPADDAARTMAARLARDAYALAPNDARVRLLYLTTMLEEAAYLAGRDKPLGDEEGAAARRAAGLGAAAIEDVLQHAIATNHPAAATAAAEILGRIGKADDLLRSSPQPAPLAVALQNPDRRLRLAAAEAIIKLKPTQAFAGSSQLVPVLSFFARTRGGPRALLAGPISADMRTVADALMAKGIQSDSVATGREMTLKAAGSPDYVLAYLDVQIDRPTAESTLQQLRREPRSADLPVALMARDGLFDAADHLARGDAKSRAFPRPHRDESIEWPLTQINQLAGRNAVAPPERQKQAAVALDLLIALADGNARFFDVARCEEAALTALLVPGLTERAATLLGKLGTPECQRALVELASRESQPAEARKMAVAQLAASIAKHGILLTTGEIERQYARYNGSAAADAQTQQILGSILNALEAPSQNVKKNEK